MRTAFISGASSEIGVALCRLYLEAGWRVVAHFRTGAGELDGLRADALETWQCDYTDTARLEATLRERPAFFQRADAVVNLAAAVTPCRFEEAAASDMLAALTVNLLPGLLLMRAVGPAMAERGFGRIVHASSIGVKFGGGSDSFTYSLSKHAQEFIPRACRTWAARNVFVNVVRIGVTDTRSHLMIPGKDMAARIGLVPAQRAATPLEIAKALFWFGSDANGFTSGQVVAVAGGE
jgi:NAD(P)-dependent dehydrogenase (short-subunit alcohol dehydrogenase family)